VSESISAPTATFETLSVKSGIDKSIVGLDKVDNTSDADKPLSDLTVLSLATKLPTINPVVSGRITAPTVNATDVNVSGNLILTGKDSILTAETIQAPPYNNINLNGYVKVSESISAPTATFGTLNVKSGIDKSVVGLDKVDNTADVNKPIRTATQSELNKKENKFNVLAPLKKTYNVLLDTNDLSLDESSIQLGLDKVDNTADVDKPISTATQNALNLKQELLTSGNIIANTNSGSILVGSKVRGIQGLNGLIIGGTPEVLTMSAPDYSQNITTVNLKVDNISATNSDHVAVNDSLKVSGVLNVDTIHVSQANEVTITSDLAIGNALLVDSIRTSNASEISVNDNVKISGYITTTGIATFSSDIMAST
jgi:hypothetical protein